MITLGHIAVPVTVNVTLCGHADRQPLLILAVGAKASSTSIANPWTEHQDDFRVQRDWKLQP
jgi:hypothetical protein